MVREIYLRRFGNPTLPEYLPKEELALELPAAPMPHEKAIGHFRDFARMLLYSAFVGGLAAQLVHWLGLAHLVTLVGLLCFAVCCPQRIAFLGTLVGLTALAPSQWLQLLTLIGPYVACLYFALTFALHHVYVRTAFPVPFTTAKIARRIALLFLARPALGLLLVPVTLAAAPIALLLAPRRAIRGFIMACHSWATYDHTNTPSAGILRTPAGTLEQRRAFAWITILLTCIYIGLPVKSCTGLEGELLDGDPLACRYTVFDQKESHWRPLPAVASSNQLPRDVAKWLRVDRPQPPTGLLRDVIGILLHIGLFVIGGPLLLFLVTSLSVAPISVILDLTCDQVAPDHIQHDRIQSQIRDSPNAIEKKSVFVGRLLEDDSPVLAPVSCFTSHAWILGGTGAGKSAALANYQEQLFSMGDCSLIVVDLKADTPEQFESLRAVAERARIKHNRDVPVKWFTNRVGYSTFAFSPLMQPWWKNLTAVQRADFIGTSTATTYTESYGQGYYSAATLHCVRAAMEANPGAQSIREIALTLDELLSGRRKSTIPNKLRSDASHVLIKLLQLSELEGLNITPQSGYSSDVLAHGIDLASLFQQPQVLYFGLPCAIGPSSSADIARLVVYSLMLTAANLRHRPIQVFLIIDEFQRCVAHNLAFVLQTARSMNVGCVLCNQSIQDLKQGATNLIPAMESCTTFRQYFKLSSLEDMLRIVGASGKAVDYLFSLTQQMGPDANLYNSITAQQCPSEYISINDANLAGANPKHSIVQITDNAGYSCYGGFPFVVKHQFHISPEEYLRRKSAPWPSQKVGTIIQSSTPPPGTAGVGASVIPPSQNPVVGVQTIAPPRQHPSARNQRRKSQTPKHRRHHP